MEDKVLTFKEQCQIVEEKFPALFSGRPWAVGTRKALCENIPEGVTKRTIHRVGYFHTSRKNYIHAVANGVERVTLDGKSGGVPTETEMAYAKGQIAGFATAKRIFKGK